jgi:hypothetical protein
VPEATATTIDNNYRIIKCGWSTNLAGAGIKPETSYRNSAVDRGLAGIHVGLVGYT